MPKLIKQKKNVGDIEDFLRESNAIEGVYDEDSLQQALYAWESLIGEKEISVSVVLKTHKILMLHQPLRPDERGYFRRCPVYIGLHEAMNWEHILIAIEQWCEEMNKKHQGGDMAMTKLLHTRYEDIHPFVDGNGRTGRMFMNWWRIKNGLPLLIIHEGEEQMEYYKWFK